MDGFLGFKCGQSCSEKKHNKEIKALIDAIDDLLAYDLETKKELGADVPNGVLDDDARMELSGRLGEIKVMADRLQGKHSFGPSFIGDQPMDLCDKNLKDLGDTADSAKERIVNRRVQDVQDVQVGDAWWGLGKEEIGRFTSKRSELENIHFRGDVLA